VARQERQANLRRKERPRPSIPQARAQAVIRNLTPKSNAVKLNPVEARDFTATQAVLASSPASRHSSSPAASTGQSNPIKPYIKHGSREPITGTLSVITGSEVLPLSAVAAARRAVARRASGISEGVRSGRGDAKAGNRSEFRTPKSRSSLRLPTLESVDFYSRLKANPIEPRRCSHNQGHHQQPTDRHQGREIELERRDSVARKADGTDHQAGGAGLSGSGWVGEVGGGSQRRNEIG
jgi:hypothetical protein